MNPWEKDPIIVPADNKPWEKDPIIFDKNSFPKDLSFTGFARDVGKGIMELPGKVKRAVSPERDPRFKDLTAFDPAELDDTTLPIRGAKNLAAKALAVEDPAYGDLLQKQLGKRFIGRTKDAKGYEILSYLDREGKKKDAYVNLPGLDYEDIDRAAAQMIPGLVASRIPGLRGSNRPGGMKTFNRVVKQGVAQGVGSVGQDLGASTMGADQDIDVHRAIFSAIGGAGGELSDTVIAKLSNVFKTRQLFKNGKLTEKGKTLAQAYGIDPTELDDKFQQQFAREMVRAEDPRAAAAKAALQNRGFNPTTAQLTRNVDDIRLERDIEAGNFNTRGSNDLSSDLREHYKQQREADVPLSISTKLEEDYGASNANRVTVGEDVAEGVRKRYQSAKSVEQAAWDAVDPSKLVPDELDRFILQQRFKNLATSNPKLYDKIRKLDPNLQPNAVAAKELIDQVIRGKAKTAKFSALGYDKSVPIDLEHVRRRLVMMRDKAFKNSGGDFNATDDIMDFYNSYLEDMAKKANIADAATLLKARDLSRELRSTFGTTGDAALDPGGRFVKGLVDSENTSPEQIARVLLDGGKDSVAAWKKLNKIFDPNAHELKLIKAAAFEQIFIDPATGRLKNFKQIADTYAKKTERYSSLYKEMFSEEELKTIGNYVKDIQKLEIPKVPGKIKSPLGQEMERIKRDGMLRYLLRRRGQAATFQSKPTESFLWQWTARSKFSQPTLSLMQTGNDRLMRRVKEGFIPYKRPRVAPRGVGATVGAAVGREFE